ncbi:metalloendopeptidase OMA1, mitochondrial-like [Macrosteles quadrilineatus]|uniref:metalloendopeptidase OMA1, mitochondrial-like n=1 Tax=Macrosteles quadrilineatus TaxID=74068 RepID=UPI0023E34A0F|nr:metalloendopeptidase OMA1, mitochondrial-like [Macrosteles quadrilineatus]
MYLRLRLNQMKNSYKNILSVSNKLPQLKHTHHNITLTSCTPSINNRSLFTFGSCNKYVKNHTPAIRPLKRYFHTTPPNKALPPILWVVLRGLLKFGAVITGRGLRKWWASLPKNKRHYILQRLKENRKNLAIVAFLTSGAVYGYYISHLVEDPITKRKKFLIFSENQIIQMSNIECDVLLENYNNKIVTSGYHYNHVLRVANRILQANKHLPGTKRTWKVFIIDDIDTKNAFVLPSGHIFIFTGMLAAVSNDDQLAAILAHEMAHALLSHAGEVASRTHLFELLLLIPLLALWTLLPTSMALSSHYLTEYLSSILFQLPMSRKLETEADTVGLEMSVRACYDPRQASAFWKNMEKMSEEADIEWLSTHPSHRTRYQTIEELMPGAFHILARHCTTPDKMDPRLPRSLPIDIPQIKVF